MSARKVVALAAAVAAVWALFAAAWWGAGPLFLIRPPITRRSAGFSEFQGGDCTHDLAQGNWTDTFQRVSCTKATRREFATCGDVPQRHWRFAAAAQSCGARRLDASEARTLLAGQRLVFAGDSIARSLYAALLRLLGTPGQGIVVGHADFHHTLEGGIPLDFFWAPYPENLTALLGSGQLGGQETMQQQQEQQQGKAAGKGRAKGAEQREAAGEPAKGEQQPPPPQQQQQQQEQQGTPRQEGPQQQAEGQQQAEVQQQAEEQPQQQQGGEVGKPGAQRRRQLHGKGQSAGAAQHAQQAQQAQQAPALVVLSTTLWHLLHFTEAADFQQRLGRLNKAAAEYIASSAGSAGTAGTAGVSGGDDGSGSGGNGSSGPRLVLTSGTEMFPNRMKTAQKQRNMTPANLDAYNAAIEQAGLLSSAGPFSLLDLFPLTRSCGEECSTDGIHSLPTVYDAALQLLLNLAASQPGQQPQQQQAERRRRTLRALRVHHV